MFPHYTEKIRMAKTLEEREQILKNKIQLTNREFKGLLSEVISSLYMHVASKDDLQSAIEAKDDETFLESVDKKKI